MTTMFESVHKTASEKDLARVAQFVEANSMVDFHASFTFTPSGDSRVMFDACKQASDLDFTFETTVEFANAIAHVAHENGEVCPKWSMNLTINDLNDPDDEGCIVTIFEDYESHLAPHEISTRTAQYRVTLKLEYCSLDYVTSTYCFPECAFDKAFDTFHFMADNLSVFASSVKADTEVSVTLYHVSKSFRYETLDSREIVA